MTHQKTTTIYIVDCIPFQLFKETGVIANKKVLECNTSILNTEMKKSPFINVAQK